MTWRIEFTRSAAKQFSGLDKPVQQRIAKFLKTRLSVSENPRSLGKALQGPLSEFWSYRVGDYRLLAHIEDQKLIILMTDIAHRRHVYK
jgi:mRNA interferase RelE/StbE